MKHLILATLILTACGTNDENPAPPLDYGIEKEPVPEFLGYNRIDGTLSCLPFAEPFQSQCTVVWMQGTENCGLATVVFVRTEAGYVYVQKLEGQNIRQGQPHTMNFNDAADVYNVKDESRPDRMEAFYYCHGADE
jgi:hypothetical protein